MSWRGVVSLVPQQEYCANVQKTSSSTTEELKSPAPRATVSSSTWSLPLPDPHTNPQDNANKDASVFPDPTKVKLDRPLDKYIYFGWGEHSCVGSEMSTIGLTAMLQCFARLPNLRRSPGGQGTLKYVIMGPVRVYMQEDWSNYSPWPTSLSHSVTFANG